MVIRNQTDRMEVVLDTEEKVVWITQRWKCRFLSHRYSDKWQEWEKKYFRKRVKSIIETTWSRKAHIVLESKSGTAFNELYGGTNFLVKVQLEFVEMGEHWNTVVYKTDEFNPAFIHWDTREIYLTNTPWENPTSAKYFAKGLISSCQTVVAHEFGHTLGNTFAHGGRNEYTGDEYGKSSPFYKDKNSIMNIGSELRKRHFAYLRDLLQSMVSGSRFAVEMGGW